MQRLHAVRARVIGRQWSERLEGHVLGDPRAHRVGFRLHAERVVVLDRLRHCLQVEGDAVCDPAADALQRGGVCTWLLRHRLQRGEPKALLRWPADVGDVGECVEPQRVGGDVEGRREEGERRSRRGRPRLVCRGAWPSAGVVRLGLGGFLVLDVAAVAGVEHEPLVVLAEVALAAASVRRAVGVTGAAGSVAASCLER